MGLGRHWIVLNLGNWVCWRQTVGKQSIRVQFVCSTEKGLPEWIPSLHILPAQPVGLAGGWVSWLCKARPRGRARWVGNYPYYWYRGPLDREKWMIIQSSRGWGSRELWMDGWESLLCVPPAFYLIILSQGEATLIESSTRSAHRSCCSMLTHSVTNGN